MIAGLVLMGGRASRLGGGDKALIEIAGRPVLDRLLERFAPQVGPLALSANGDLARLAAYDLPVLPDPENAPEGPLGGVLAGLDWAAALPGVTHLATVPGDAPCPPENLVTRLAAAAGDDAAAGDGAAAAHGPRGVEPLHALWPLAALPRIRALAADGVRSPKRMLERLDAAAVAFDDPAAFLDLDTPEDVERAAALLKGT